MLAIWAPSTASSRPWPLPALVAKTGLAEAPSGHDCAVHRRAQRLGRRAPQGVLVASDLHPVANPGSPAIEKNAGRDCTARGWRSSNGGPDVQRYHGALYPYLSVGLCKYKTKTLQRPS
jgi:hypothetical protein